MNQLAVQEIYDDVEFGIVDPIDEASPGVIRNDLLPHHPDNHLSIVSTNPISNEQIRTLSLRDRINPWEFISANTDPVAKQAMNYYTNMGSGTYDTIYMYCPPLPLALDAVPNLDGTNDERMARISTQVNVARVERANHIANLPFLVAVNPDQSDKTYQGIMHASLEKWTRRVYQYAVQVLAHHPTGLSQNVRYRIEAGYAEPYNLTQHRLSMSNLVEQIIRLDDRGGMAAAWAAADDTGKNILKTWCICKTLKEWTREWEMERVALEERYFGQGIGDTVDPRNL